MHVLECRFGGQDRTELDRCARHIVRILVNYTAEFSGSVATKGGGGKGDGKGDGKGNREVQRAGTNTGTKAVSDLMSDAALPESNGISSAQHYYLQWRGLIQHIIVLTSAGPGIPIG